MISEDGFITLHSIENTQTVKDSEVKKFADEYYPEHYFLKVYMLFLWEKVTKTLSRFKAV